MISRNLEPVLRAAHKQFDFSVAMPIAGALGNVGYFIRIDDREYFCGNAECFTDDVIVAYSMVFRSALNYKGSKVLLLVDGDLYQFDPKLYIESESPWLKIKLCLSAGRVLK